MRCLVSIATLSYVPRALVLMSTFLETNRGVDVILFVPDLSEAAVRAATWPLEERLTVLGVDAILDTTLAGMHTYMTAFEFSCAMKSFALHHVLFSLRYEQALLLDPDIACFAGFERTWSHLAQASICVTPHSNTPQPDDGKMPDDREFLNAGFVNGGFWALKRTDEARRCLNWIKAKVTHFGFFIPRLNLYADQSWMSAIPWLFPSDTEVIRAPGYNVAYWNLHERSLAFVAGKYCCGGEPLVFFHFSGFDESNPGRLTRHSDRRHDAPTEAALAQMLDHYAERLRKAAAVVPRIAPDRPCATAALYKRLRQYRAMHGASAQFQLGPKQLWLLGPRAFLPS